MEEEDGWVVGCSSAGSMPQYLTMDLEEQMRGTFAQADALLR